MTRVCRNCEEELNLEEFFGRAGKGWKRVCTPCAGHLYEDTYRTCKRCAVEKLPHHFDRTNTGRCRAKCRECVAAIAAAKTKQCRGCEVSKTMDHFDQTNTGRYRMKCRECAANAIANVKQCMDCAEHKPLVEFDHRGTICRPCVNDAVKKLCAGCRSEKRTDLFPCDGETCHECNERAAAAPQLPEPVTPITPAPVDKYAPPTHADAYNALIAATVAAARSKPKPPPAPARYRWTMDEATQRQGETFDDFLIRIVATLVAIQKKCYCLQIEVDPEEKLRVCETCDRIMNKIVPDLCDDDVDEDMRDMLWSRDTQRAVFAASKTNDDVYYDYVEKQKERKSMILSAREAAQVIRMAEHEAKMKEINAATAKRRAAAAGGR